MQVVRVATPLRQVRIYRDHLYSAFIDVSDQLAQIVTPDGVFITNMGLSVMAQLRAPVKPMLN